MFFGHGLPVQRSQVSAAWLVDRRLFLRSNGLHLFRRLVMAWLAHAIWFRCEVVALPRLVTMRL
jgi:hypothetical protein